MSDKSNADTGSDDQPTLQRDLYTPEQRSGVDGKTQSQQMQSGGFEDPNVGALLNSESDGDKPDPSEVDSINTAQHVFQRDENGDLLPKADVVKVSGEWQRVEHIPPTKGFLGRVQNRFAGRDDVDLEEIDALMSDFYSDPDIDDWDDVSSSLYLPLMKHMVSVVAGGSDDEVMQELQGAVEDRQAEGN